VLAELVLLKCSQSPSEDGESNFQEGELFHCFNGGSSVDVLVEIIKLLGI